MKADYSRRGTVERLFHVVGAEESEEDLAGYFISVTTNGRISVIKSSIVSAKLPIVGSYSPSQR